MKMKHYITLIIILFFTTLMVSSCAKQGEAEYPSYLVVDTMIVNAKIGEGSSTARFPFVWLYANNVFRGGFPVGSKIPILDDGEVEIELRPGIYTDGEVVRTDVYFNMKPYKTTVPMKRLETTHVKARFEYEDYINFAVIEDFEDGNIFMEDFDSNPKTKLERTSNNVCEGMYSGLLKVSRIDSANAVAMHTPVTEFSWKVNPNMWIELDFMGNTDLVVGLAGISEGGMNYNLPFISLKPQEEYRKVYLDLTEEIINHRALSVTVYVMAAYNKSYDAEDQRVYFDNFKIITN